MKPREEIRKRFDVDLKSLALLEDYLRESVEICRQMKADQLSRKDLREIGALTDRFQRAQDFFVSRILRSIDELAGDEGTTEDVLNRSEKRGLIGSASDFLDMRVLRNKIAHEYAGYGPMDIVNDILEFTPMLLLAFQQTREYNIL